MRQKSEYARSQRQKVQSAIWYTSVSNRRQRHQLIISAQFISNNDEGRATSNNGMITLGQIGIKSL
jgi:hypothetical protein